MQNLPAPSLFAVTLMFESVTTDTQMVLALGAI
jgi:hypothetical protein